MATTHAPRRTDKTGKYYEYFIEYLLGRKGYNVDEQDNIGLRPTGGEHNTDLIVEDWDTGEKEIISLKIQMGQGTAEEKVPYEAMCLQHACETYGYTHAVIVLAGDGWKHDDAYINGAFSKWMNTPDVEVISHDTFMERYDLNGVILKNV